MPVTKLIVPTLVQVKAMNALTDGTGNLRVPDSDGMVASIFEMQDAIFDFGAAFFDFNDPVVLGLTWAYLIANEHIFEDGNKSTATLVLKFIIENNDSRFVDDFEDAMLVDIVNGLVPEDDESVNKEAICAAAFKLRDFVVPA